MSRFLAQAQTIGRSVLAGHAESVDQCARFPREGIGALREASLLGAMVPAALGGAGATLSELTAVCHALAQHCASTAMIYAMHQIQVACLVQNGINAPWHRDLLCRIATEQLLLASATTEGATGGDVGRSACALAWAGESFSVEKHGAVISYGDDADGILLTARRDEAAAPTDQALAVLLRDDFELEMTDEWDALGMRGTGSRSFRVTARGHADQVVPRPYAEISTHTMLPTSHLLWSGLWSGIAAGAVARAQAYVRRAARRTPGALPPGATRLAEAVSMLQQMHGNVAAAARRYEQALGQSDDLGSFSLTIEMNLLKTSVSQMAVQVINQALLICGLSGYRTDSEFSVGRQLRDAHSAALMVNNDRITGNTAQMLLIQKAPTELAL